MVADNTSINRELDNLIHEQIHMFKRDAKISDPELDEFRQRSQRIRVLCRTLNQASSKIPADQPAA